MGAMIDGTRSAKSALLHEVASWTSVDIAAEADKLVLTPKNRKVRAERSLL